MAFLAPLFLAGAATAAIPILVHLLRREPDARVRFSAVRLLRAAPVEHARRRRVRELLLLAARITALLLLALAFARPFFTSPAAAGAGGLTVVALDTSASLSAAGQFERARQLARQAIERASGGLVGVVTFADTARVAAELSADRSIATAAIAAAHAGPGATSYRAALHAAADLLGGRPGTIVVVTDLQASGWAAGDGAVLPESARIDIADVGAPPPNLAVVAARASGGRVVATIRNAGARVRNANVNLAVHVGPPGRQPARTVADAVVAVEAGQSADVLFPIPQGAWAVVRVDDGQGAVEDNARYLVLEGMARPSVLVVTSTGDVDREAFYVTQALVASGAGGGAYDVEGVGGATLQSWDQLRLERHAAVVLLSTRGLDHHGRALLADYTRRGGGVLAAAGPDVDGEALSEVLGRPSLALAPPAAGQTQPVLTRRLAPADVRHPLFRALTGQSSLGLVTFRRVTTMRAAGCQTLARFTTGESAVVECDEGQGRAIVVASDLDNRGNDFPLHATFVPFLHEALRYLSDEHQSSSAFVVGGVPAGVPPVPGVASMAATPGRERLVSVNVDPVESNAARLTVDEFEAAVTRLKDPAGAERGVQGTEHEERQRVWQYVLVLMAATLVVESFVAMRAA